MGMIRGCTNVVTSDGSKEDDNMVSEGLLRPVILRTLNPGEWPSQPLWRRPAIW